MNKKEREEYKKITGFYTHEELAAYEKGREDEGKVMIAWIKKWNGSTNSSMGKILLDKLSENQIFLKILNIRLAEIDKKYEKYKK